MKRKRVIIAIYLVAMLLYLLATVLKISFGGHVVGSENHIVTEIESVNAKFPIGEKEIAFLEALFEDRELKEIKEANIFVGNFGVYEFKVTESSERQLIFSEDLYELAKQEVGISVFYNEKKAVIAGSDMMLGENENLISEMLLREYFDMEAEELPTTVVQVQMDSNVDLNTLEEKLLKRGLHFKDYSRNKYNMLTSSGIELIEFLFKAITLLNYVLTIFISYRICKENRQNIAILRMHGYQKNEVRLLLLFQFGKLFMGTVVLLVILYYPVLFSLRKLTRESLLFENVVVHKLLVKFGLIELLIGGITTLIICEVYVRTNILKLIKKGK